MQSTTGKIVMVLVGLVAAYIVLGLVLKVAMGILATAMPLLIIGGVAYVLYQAYGRKALGGGRRTLP